MIPSPDKHFGLNLRLSGENLSPRVTVYVTIAQRNAHGVTPRFTYTHLAAHLPPKKNKTRNRCTDLSGG